MVGVRGRGAELRRQRLLVNTATGGGDTLIKTGKLSGRPKNRDVLFGRRARAAARHPPDRPSKKPPYKPDKACYKNAKPNLNGPAANPGPPDTGTAREEGPVRHAISKNMRDFIAVIVMSSSRSASGGYILSNQRFYLPAWVPVLGTDFFELKGEFSTAQSVTPGQGQTVDIAGVPVGEIKQRRARWTAARS